MSTSVAPRPPQAVKADGEHGSSDREQDPFTPTPGAEQRRPHRYSSFDTELFAMNHASSPSQAKRALEAHLTETDRRLQEASRLGTALVQQRKELSARLAEVEQQQGEREIGPELRQRLIEVEKEYTEIGRESARAFLVPKTRIQSSDETSNGHATMDARRPASPSKFTSQATDSPSKLNVPSRKQRNQPSNRVHDIEFATEISQSLLGQVRQLQALLVERDESLKTVNLEKSRLELDAQGFSQRLRSLDESEQRYKDENWALETRTHELIAEAKQSTDREQRLQQALTVTNSEKSAAQRELDDIKQAHGKLTDDHTAFRKGHEAELASLRKNLTMGESDRASLHRKVEELTSQNQELARAVASQFRGDEEAPAADIGSEPEELFLGRSDAEHSPPGSPSKATNRHTMLESETLKSSLHHAHRMIQNLKSNIHREKTEKLELKRMLQESRDELELRRGESSGTSNGNKRLKSKSQVDMSKKNRLGMVRNSRTDVEVDDNGWEDHKDGNTPGATATTKTSIRSAAGLSKLADATDPYQTTNDTEDAFETANERDTSTENEAFMTGNEHMAGESSDDLTETEGGVGRSRISRDLKHASIVTAKPGQRSSFISTASTSASDEEPGVNTPAQSQPQKYRLKINRNSRRSRIASEGPMSSGPSSMRNSPASFISTSGGNGQSLFAELGELNADDSGEEMGGTPSRSSVVSRRSTPAPKPSSSKQDLVQTTESSVTRLPMIDSGMMTESWGPPNRETPVAPMGYALPRAASPIAALPATPPPTTALPAIPTGKDLNVQRTPTSTPQMAESSNLSSTAPRKAWDAPLQDFVSNIPTFGPALTSTPFSTLSGASRDVKYTTPSGKSENPTPIRSLGADSATKQSEDPVLPSLSFSQIQSLETKPIEPAPLIAPAIPSRDVRRLATAEDGPAKISATSDALHNESSKGGVIGSVLGWARNKRSSTPQPADEESVQDLDTQPMGQQTREPFKEVAANVAQREPTNKLFTETPKRRIVIDMTDQSSQTTLSAEQIDTILSIKASKPPSIREPSQRLPLSQAKSISDMGISAPQQKEVSPEGGQLANKSAALREAAPLTKALKRPSSSGSIRTSATIMPPLPPDHRQAIAAAANRTTPAADGTATTMGPPTAPASAYRPPSARPRTPSEQRGQALNALNTRTSTTPRARYSTARSQMSRRSSVTSFESELDQRFNIRADGMPMPHGLDPGADPRMIQAITQTMIGEYLWKYTRKAGRGEMSDNRHRRFFWVHPYTRTLYWSDQDPATAGRAQLKAKSVAIEGVRVVTDDNPMPPGLHRKSLMILTPGRAVKFTATTGQRHETWFNSLSYLILRTGADPHQYTNNDGLTAEDIAEFNPALGASRQRSGSRATRMSHVSLSSYNSRPVTASRQSSRNASPSRTMSAQSNRPPQGQMQQMSTGSRYSDTKHASVGSRLSMYWKPQPRGSVSSRHGKESEETGHRGGIYDASVVHDSAEDLRRIIEQQEEEADRLENVRACCDGRHDVGSLSKRSFFGGRMGSSASRHDHHH